MKNCIITPTFSGHFQYIPDYLKSFQINATPKDNFEICFTISKSEAESFSKITRKYPDLNIKVLFFEDILAHFHITETPDFLLQKYKKFTFQTLKKFYTMLYLGPEYRFLVLDSESIMYRPYDINKLFDDFFDNPYICGSDVQKRLAKAWIIFSVKKSTSFILKQKSDKWFLENFVWFYDYKIISDLFAEHGNLIDIVDDFYKTNDDNTFSAVFEIDLYQAYIYQNLKKYNYKFFNINDVLSRYLPQELLEKYEESFFNKYQGRSGLVQHALTLLTPENVKQLNKLFQDLKFNIIRCNETTIQSYNLQKQFLNAVRPVILASSQDHYFGVKHNMVQFFKMVSQHKNIQKLKQHLKSFFAPFRPIIKWLLDPLSIVKYTIKSIVDIIRSFIKVTYTK